MVESTKDIINPLKYDYVSDPITFEHLMVVLQESVLPSEAYRFKPDYEKDVFFPFKKVKLRSIFYGGWKLDEIEEKELEKFRQYLAKKKL